MSDGPKNLDRRISEYVRGQASEEEARELELEMLEDDDLFERVQTEDLLRRGLEENERAASSGAADGTASSAPLPHLAWALAASFGAAAVLLGVYSLHLGDRIERLQSPSTGVPVITLFEQRSLLPKSADPPVNLSGHEGPVFLEIDVSAHQHESFQLELVRDAGSLIWESEVPDERGYLTILAPGGNSLKSIEVRSPEGEVLKTYRLRED
ncbi:MAG: hypothetical protein GVY32_06665 [Gammaproteobacteria bacterium]|jgi:hypothetical protein|nr:hypothetical protein [Gammaproteobacteria bacterium]